MSPGSSFHGLVHSLIHSFIFLAIIASKLTMPQALCSYIRQGDRMRSAIILNDVWRQGYNTDQLFEDKCNEVSLNMYDFIPGIATTIFNTYHKTLFISVEETEAKKGK